MHSTPTDITTAPVAGDGIARALKDERAHQRRQREWERERGSDTNGGEDAEPMSEEQVKEVRRLEREAEQEARRAAVAYNAELGAEVVKHLSRVKVDERAVKVLAAIDIGGELDAIAMRGARYGFPGWPQESETKTGKPKLDYLDRAEAGARAREYLGVAKTASDYAGRLLALVVMARYAKEDAVARSNRSFSPLSVGRSLPWSGEVLDLVDELAAERLSDHLTAAVREQRAGERAQEAEEAERRASIDERSARLDELGADERAQLLEDARQLLVLEPGVRGAAPARRGPGRNRPAGCGGRGGR